MRIHALLAALILTLGLAGSAPAQFRQVEQDGPKLGEPQTQKWRAGVIVSAAAGPCRGIVSYIPMPIDWPEQEVEIVEENVSPGARVSYRSVDQTVQLMVVAVPFLAAGQQAQALVTMEVRRSAILPPEQTGDYLLPDKRKLNRLTRIYLAPSPMIESTDARIRKLARELVPDRQQGWQRVEAIYDWVRENVEYKNGPIKGALAALKDGSGDCEELTSLFIAICRAADIPARTVWVPGHCYPEFYLTDAEGKGQWFPCQAAGTRSFGGIPEHRPILQKGDNFRPPWNPRQRQRYLAEHLTGTGGRPRVKFVRELVSD